MNNPEQTHHITALLMTHAKGIKKTKIDDLKMMVVQASKTFEHNEMMAFSRAAEILSKQNEWTHYDITRARCMALYHMYIMFEFDSKKSEINEQKHGINFVDAQQLCQLKA